MKQREPGWGKSGSKGVLRDVCEILRSFHSLSNEDQIGDTHPLLSPHPEFSTTGTKLANSIIPTEVEVRGKG